MSTQESKPLNFVVDRRTLAKSSFAGLSAAALARVAPVGASDRTTRWEFFRAQNAETTPVAVDDYSPAALTAGEYAVLTAAVGRIIPTDDLGPGAIEAGAQIYIDRALAGRYAASLPMYQQGLAALDAASGGFAAAAEADQDATLTSAEAGELADLPESFFATLIEHTRQGVFSDPIHGGNREFIGWDLINYPGIKIAWTAEEQAIGTVVEPMHLSVEAVGGQPL